MEDSIQVLVRWKFIIFESLIISVINTNINSMCMIVVRLTQLYHIYKVFYKHIKYYMTWLEVIKHKCSKWVKQTKLHYKFHSGQPFLLILTTLQLLELSDVYSVTYCINQQQNAGRHDQTIIKKPLTERAHPTKTINISSSVFVSFSETITVTTRNIFLSPPRERNFNVNGVYTV